MRFATYLSDSGPRSAVIRNATFSGRYELIDLHAHDTTLPPSVKALFEQGEEGMQRAQRILQEGQPLDLLTPITLMPPIVSPQKIICVGLNYADHAAETGGKVGAEPVIFCKFPTTLIGPEAPIVLPGESNEVDYEAELVVVIGKEAHRVPEADALDYVAGYTCGHDVSARDWQKGKPGKQWLLGKSFDTFAPLGPWIVTPDELGNPDNLTIQMHLNGEVMQDSNTSHLIFSIPYLIAYLSKVCTLLPGDLIYTGTPPGVGMARQPPVFLKPGDKTEVSIESIGTLSNPVVASP